MVGRQRVPVVGKRVGRRVRGHRELAGPQRGPHGCRLLAGVAAVVRDLRRAAGQLGNRRGGLRHVERAGGRAVHPPALRQRRVCVNGLLDQRMAERVRPARGGQETVPDGGRQPVEVVRRDGR